MKRQRTTHQSAQTWTPLTSGVLQRACACGQHTTGGGECAACRDKKQMLQRHSAGHAEPASVPAIVHEVLRSPGQPLDSATRAFMESRFGHDFSQVRVHTDTKAAESARAVNALAYTVGRDIVFGEGQYALGTSEGERLLAHELTHVVQQRYQRSSNAQGVRQLNDEYHELEASRIADTIQSAVIAPDLSFTRVHDTKTLLQRNGDGKERSRQSRPRNAPRGTRPIDESGLDREDIHKIKDRIGAGPRDWVGITPDGDVITTDEEGNAENHGPASDYLRESHPEVPSWVWPLVAVVGIFVVIAIIACFATGVCEFAAIVAGLSYATALLIIGLLKRAGIKNSGGTTTAAVETQAGSSEEMA